MTERKLWAIEFGVVKAADSDTISEEGKVVNIGLEGINIIDAIMALGSILPDGTEYEVLSAKLEAVIPVDGNIEVSSGTVFSSDTLIPEENDVLEDTATEDMTT